MNSCGINWENQRSRKQPMVEKTEARQNVVKRADKQINLLVSSPHSFDKSCHAVLRPEHKSSTLRDPLYDKQDHL